jgi:hypothetical protein
LQISPFRDCRLHRETKNAMPKRHGGAARHARSLPPHGRFGVRFGAGSAAAGPAAELWFDYDTGIQTCQAFAATFPKDAQRLKNGTYCEKISQLVVIKTTGLGIEITEKILYIVHRKPASAGVGAGKVQICWKGNRNYGTDRLQIH